MSYNSSQLVSILFGTEADISYTIYDGSPPKLESGTGIPLEPAEPASVEIHSIIVSGPNGKKKLDILPIFPQEAFEELEDIILEKETSHATFNS